MKQKDYKVLLQKYIDGICTDDERKIVESWLENRVRSSDWEWADEEHKIRIQTRIRKFIIQSIYKKNRRPAILAIAASFSVIFLFIYLFQSSYQPDELHWPQENVQLIIDGDQIINLGSSEIGILTDDGSIAIKKTSDKSLLFKKSLTASGKAAKMNTLIVPIGKQYQLTLPDGTEVWLNCESSIRFPSRFTDDERLVELQGEAYFEVFADADRPFRVIAKDQIIKVLGTHFNVSAYPDQDQTRTTLIEGLVQVTQGEHKVELTSGRQAISSSSQQLYDRAIDPHSEVAWKEGYFSFVNQDIQSVMDDVA